MRGSLRRLGVEELIVHDVPKKLSQRVLRQNPVPSIEEPIFSDVPSPISQEIIHFFHGKIIETVGSTKAIDVKFNSSNDSPVPDLIEEYFSTSSDRRLLITKEIAQHLFDKQNAQNPAGLLLFIRCSFNEQIGLAILKVEREEGVRIRQDLQNGLRTFNVQHIQDLMLTKKTKLFKIILFYLEGGRINGVLCDQQQRYGSKEVADFFLQDFLGCELTEQSSVVTKKFFELTQKYINEIIESPEQKGELLNHLLSELTSQQRIVDPHEFTARALPVRERDNYIDFLREHDCVINSFVKDCSMIENKLKTIQYDLNSGISIFGQREAINNNLTIENIQNGRVKIEIIDELKQVRTK